MKTTEKTTREIFFEYFKGKENLITPQTIDYFRHKNFAIELSKGKCFEHENIYGVTILEIKANNIEHRHNISKMFHDQNEAKEYIKKIGVEIF